jgi:hypothetical protein
MFTRDRNQKNKNIFECIDSTEDGTQKMESDQDLMNLTNQDRNTMNDMFNMNEMNDDMIINTMNSDNDDTEAMPVVEDDPSLLSTEDVVFDDFTELDILILVLGIVFLIVAVLCIIGLLYVSNKKNYDCNSFS